MKPMRRQILVVLLVAGCGVALLALAGCRLTPLKAATPIAGAEPGAGVWSDESDDGDERADASDESESYGGDFELTATEDGHYAARVPDPDGSPRKVVELTTDESLGDDQAVRMQLSGDRRLDHGEEVWILNEFYLPDDFPDLSSDGWLSLSSVYGPPADGAGPNTIGMRFLDGANRFTWIEEPGGDSTLWEGPTATPGTWHVVVRHMKLDSDADEGFMEIYYGERGEPLELQTLSGSAAGTTRHHYATLTEGVNWDGETPNSLNISNYHRDNMPGWEDQVSIYFANHRVFAAGTPLEGIERYSSTR